MTDRTPIATPPRAGDQDAGKRSLVGMLRLSVLCLQAIIIVLFVAYLFSGTYAASVLKENEVAFRVRFGKIVGTGSGAMLERGNVNFAWPAPIDQIVKLPVREAQTVKTVNFWYRAQGISVSNPQNNRFTGALEPGQDFYLITGDFNILHSKWSVTYRIVDAILYHTQYADPEDTIRRLLENAVIKVVSGRRIDETLYHGETELRNDVAVELHRLIDALNPNIGIRIDPDNSVIREQKEAPGGTADAFDAITRADDDQAKLLSETKTTADELVQAAKRQGARILSEARQYRKRVETTLAADQSMFKILNEEIEEHGVGVLIEKKVESLTRMLKNADSIYLLPPATKGSGQIRILIGPEPLGPGTIKIENGEPGG